MRIIGEIYKIRNLFQAITPIFFSVLFLFSEISHAQNCGFEGQGYVQNYARGGIGARVVQATAGTLIGGPMGSLFAQGFSNSENVSNPFARYPEFVGRALNVGCRSALEREASYEETQYTSCMLRDRGYWIENLRNIEGVVDYFDNTSEELLFLTAAKQLNSFARCQGQLVDTYFTNAEVRNDYHVNAYNQFKDLSVCLRPLLQYSRTIEGRLADDVMYTGNTNLPGTEIPVNVHTEGASLGASIMCMLDSERCNNAAAARRADASGRYGAERDAVVEQILTCLPVDERDQQRGILRDLIKPSQEGVEKMSQYINVAISRIPLANRDGMGNAMKELILNNPNISQSDFNTRFRNEMMNMRRSINETLNYFEGPAANREACRAGLEDEPGSDCGILRRAGNKDYYCVDRNFKENLVQSGQITNTTEALRGEELIDNGLICRTENRYSSRSLLYSELALIPTYFVGWGFVRGAGMLALRGGARLGRAASLMSRATAYALRGVEVADYASIASGIERECFRESSFLNTTEDMTTCNPMDQVAQSYEEASLAQCMTSLALPAATALVGTTVRVVSSRRLSSANQLAAAKMAEGDSITVTATRRQGNNPLGRNEARIQALINRRVDESGDMRFVNARRGENGGRPYVETRDHQVEFGCYFQVLLDPSGVLYLTEYASQHGGHRLLEAATRAEGMEGRARRDPVVGGVVFTEDGIRVSGKALRYPSEENARAISRRFRKMGFRVSEVTGGSLDMRNSRCSKVIDRRDFVRDGGALTP